MVTQSRVRGFLFLLIYLYYLCFVRGFQCAPDAALFKVAEEQQQEEEWFGAIDNNRLPESESSQTSGGLPVQVGVDKTGDSNSLLLRGYVWSSRHQSSGEEEEEEEEEEAEEAAAANDVVVNVSLSF
jgi:hypothetical protein